MMWSSTAKPNETQGTQDTTRLKPVVLELHNYIRNLKGDRTPPGFSRWYFKFTTTNETQGTQDTTGVS